MPDLDKTTLHNWLHHWQDEYDAAFLYLVLAGQEGDPKKKEIYIKLAGVEERHTQMWEKLLAEHGHPIPKQGTRPSLNARLRAWFGRRFGPGYLLPLLLREEGQEVRLLKLAESLGATVVKVLADRPSEGLVAFAQREGITHVIFGQSARSRWEILWRGSTLNRFLSTVRDAAVQVVPLDVG